MGTLLETHTDTFSGKFTSHSKLFTARTGHYNDTTTLTDQFCDGTFYLFYDTVFKTNK